MAYMSAREMLSGLPVKMAEGGPVHMATGGLTPIGPGDPLFDALQKASANAPANKTYGNFGATAKDIQTAAVNVRAQIADGSYDPAAGYAEIMKSGISVTDAIEAGIEPSLIDAIFTTPTALTPGQLSSQGQTSVIGSGTAFANALTQESVDAAKAKILKDGIIDDAERLEMQKVATAEGVTFQDMISFGVDPNMLYKTPEAGGGTDTDGTDTDGTDTTPPAGPTTKICPVGTLLEGSVIGINEDCGVKPATATTKICPAGTLLAGQEIGINDSCGIVPKTDGPDGGLPFGGKVGETDAEKAARIAAADAARLAASNAAYTSTQLPYTATPVYPKLPDNTGVYAAGEESLDTTFRESAPRTEFLDQYGNVVGLDYTTGADLLSATGSGFSFTPPTVTGRKRSLMGTDQVNRLNQGRAAADLRQLSFQPGLSAAENETRYNSYAGLLDNPGSYSGGLSRSQIYARQQAEDFRRGALPPVVDDIGNSGTVQEYLAMFPDVGESFTSQKSSGTLPANMTLNQFARNHYAKFGIDEMANDLRRQFTLLPQDAADVVPGLPGAAVPDDLAKFMTPAGVPDPYTTNSSNWNLTDGQLAEGMFGDVGPIYKAHGGSVKKPQGFADGGTASADLLEKTAGVPGIARNIYNYGKDVVTAPSPSAKLLADAMGVGMKATNDPVQYGAELLGFDDARQLAIMREAVEINNQMVDANLIPPDFRVRFKEAPEGSPGTRENVSLDGDEEYFNTINHALFSYYAGQNPIAGLGAQIKEVKQGLQQIDRGNNPRTEYLDYFNNQFGLNLAKQGLSPAEAKNAIIDNVANIGGQGTRGRMQRGEEIKAGTDLLTNVQDAKYPWEKYAESAMAKADKIRAENPQGFADGGSASSEPTAEELTAQLIAMDAQAAPAERPLDQEQTESRNILDRLTSTPFTKEGDRSIFGSALAGIPGAVESAIGYGKDVVTAPSPSAKLLADIFVTGGAMRQSAEEDPLGYLGETLPPFAQVNALNQVDELNKQVNEARRNGNEEEAKRLEKFITVTALGAFPFIKGGVRPKTPGTAVARGTPEVPLLEGELLPAGAGRTSSRQLLDDLSGDTPIETPLLEAPAPRPEAPAPALAPEVGEALKMLDEVDSIPAPKSNLTKTETATLNKSAGRNEELRASANLAGENFKTNYPVDGGWAPVEITGVKFKNGNAKVTTKKIPYAFQNTPEGVSNDEWEQKLSTGLVDGVENIILRTKNGDQAALDIIAQANWYRTMRNQLRSEFGGIGDVFADVIGATSAQTNVEQNFNNSVDIIRKYSRGDYDLELEAFERRMDQGLKVDGKTLIQMHKAGEFPLITKDSGAMFNSNSPAAMGALLDIFRNIKAGKSPKTPNFTGNLIGLTNEATIDVWAGRKLRDLAGLPRIPPSAEQAVAGAHRVKSTLADPNVGSEFGFGQRVFRKAATELNKSGALKKVFPDLGDLGPDDLQAIVWFIEKEQWTKNGWTTKSGEGGSLDYEMSLLGSSEPSRIRELRREVNAGFKPPQQRKIETDSAYQLRTMDALKDFETGRNAAKADLESLSSTADRVVVGISGARPERPMTNYQQAELAAPLDDVVRDDPNVRGYGITSTQGLYMNEAERSLNAEFVVGKSFDPAPLRLRVLELGKEYNQDSVLFSKVVEEGAPNARPGVEIYFKEKLPEEAMSVIVNRLMERGVDGFTYITDSRFSDKINRQFRSGNQPDNAGITGIRFQYVPEFDESFDPQKATEMYKDKLDSFSDIVGDIILDETKLKIGKNSEATLGGNVSDARIVHYDTEVFFRGDYDDYIAKHTRPDDSQTGGGRSGGSNNEKANRGSKEGAGPPRAVRDGVGGATSTKANEEITALNKSGDPLGINVAVDKNGTDYADLIVNGTKKFESRETPSLKPYVGKRVGIVRTGAGPAEVIGSVEIGQPIEVNQRDFNKLRDQHLVAEDSSFNIKKGQTKFLYPMIDPMTTAPQKVTSKGIVARAVPAAIPAQQALPKVDPSLPKYEGMRDATVQHLKNKGIMSQSEFDRAERDSFEKTGNWDSMPEPKAVYTIEDSGSNSSYVTIKKPKNYVEEGIGDPDEYTIRFSDHSLPKQYAYDQNIYNVSEDYYDETINGKTLNDAINYVNRLLPNTPAAIPAKRNKITFKSFLMPGLGGSLGEARKELSITPEKIEIYKDENKGTKQKPIPQVMAAAKKLKAGEISTQEYIQIAEEFQPIKPLGAVQKRPTDEAIAMALGKNEADSAGIVGVNIDIPDGTMISSRLDIPAYEFRNTWVVTLHDGTRNSGLAVGYGPTAVLNDVNFTTTSATAALNMATNDTNKGTIARINGSWENREPAEVEQLARDILSGKAPDADDWVEVGMNPFRHSYFYRKADGMPVASAEEVIQVGPLVLAKKAKTRPIESPEHLIKTPEGTPPTYFKKGGAIERVYNNPRYI